MNTSLKIFFLTALIASVNYCFAGADNLPVGAKQAALGNAAVATSDVWSVYHNQAGLASIEKPSVGIYASQGYMLQQTSQGAIAIVQPSKYGTFALSYNRFGFKLYNEGKAGFAFARKFGENLRAGAQINLNTIAIGDIYGNKSSLTFEAGVQTKLTKNLWVGAHIYNIARTSVNEIEKIPVIVKFGFYYTFNENVNTSIEYEKNWTIQPLYKAGLEYKLAKEFALRFGINAGAFTTTSFGASYIHKKFSIDAAYAFNTKLGSTPHLGLTYVFK